MDMTSKLSVSEGETSSEKCENPCQPEFLEYLSRAYGLLRIIFSYLDLDDIKNAAEAFDSWYSVADVTRKERSSFESFVISDQKYKMSKIWNEAAFCISFCTSPNPEFQDEVTKHMIQSGHYLHCLSGAGVIGTVHDLSQIIQQKVRVGFSVSPKKFYMTALRIPNIPKVGIRTFVWEEYMDPEEFIKGFDIPTDQVIKCLLILMVAEGNGRDAYRQKDNFIQFLQSRQKENFAIGGCTIDDFNNYSRYCDSHSVTHYIVFFGDNIEAASTVLTAEINSLNKINAKIGKLKERCPVVQKGALFVFRCAGRQRVIRGSKVIKDMAKWEGEAIQKYFPSTPVIGCFGYGEFGREHPYEPKKSMPSKKPKRLFNWDFSFSTSIVYIGFKK